MNNATITYIRNEYDITYEEYVELKEWLLNKSN